MFTQNMRAELLPRELIRDRLSCRWKRTKQLLRGAEARVAGDHKRRKGTSIALEELKLGLVRFAS